MKFREHRGSLEASMKTVIDVKDLDELVKYINTVLNPYNRFVTKSQVHIEPYGKDDRIGWYAYIVTIDDYGVFGFTNGELV